jgi:hypothetical protein
VRLSIRTSGKSERRLRAWREFGADQERPAAQPVAVDPDKIEGSGRRPVRLALGRAHLISAVGLRHQLLRRRSRRWRGRNTRACGANTASAPARCNARAGAFPTGQTGGGGAGLELDDRVMSAIPIRPTTWLTSSRKPQVAARSFPVLAMFAGVWTQTAEPLDPGLDDLVLTTLSLGTRCDGRVTKIGGPTAGADHRRAIGENA